MLFEKASRILLFVASGQQFCAGCNTARRNNMAHEQSRTSKTDKTGEQQPTRGVECTQSARNKQAERQTRKKRSHARRQNARTHVALDQIKAKRSKKSIFVGNQWVSLNQRDAGRKKAREKARQHKRFLVCALLEVKHLSHFPLSRAFSNEPSFCRYIAEHVYYMLVVCKSWLFAL